MRNDKRLDPNTSPGTLSQAEQTEQPTLNGAARAAADEMAEATDLAAAGGFAVGPAAQAEEVAAGATIMREETLAPAERREVARNVFRLAWPAITENALQTLLGIVDTAIVARLGTAALSGVGASQQLIWLLTTALIAVGMGSTVLVAHSIGAKDRKAADAALKQSLLVAMVLGLALVPLGFIALPIMQTLGLTPDAAREGATYLQITLFCSVVLVIMFIAGAALRGAGDTKTPMLVTGFINIINAVVAVELVFGGAKASGILSGWLGAIGLQVTLPTLTWIPEMGVAGSAWATVIARTVGAALLLSVFLLPRSPLRLWHIGGWLPNFEVISRIIRIGLPTAVEQMLMSLGITVYSLIVISMGEVIFATSRLALNAVFLSMLPGFGFSMAATTLVGQALGARQVQRAWLGTRLATRSCIAWMGGMGLVFFFFGEPLMRLFTDDPRLITLGADALKVIALGQPPLAIAFVLSGALRGAGDVRFPMWVTTLAVWAVRLPTGAFMGLNSVCIPFTTICMPGLGWGLQGIYAALIVESSLRAVLLYWRFRSGKWQTMKV